MVNVDFARTQIDFDVISVCKKHSNCFATSDTESILKGSWMDWNVFKREIRDTIQKERICAKCSESIRTKANI